MVGGCLSSPESGKFAGGDGSTPGVLTVSLGAIWLGLWGQKIGESGGA